MNFTKSYLRPILVNDWDIEPIALKKADQLASFNFGKVQLLDNLNFPGGATNIDCFLKPYKTSETNLFLPNEWFNHPVGLNNKKLLLMKLFATKYGNVKILKKTILTTRSWSVVVWWQRFPWPKWDSLKNHLLKQRTIPTCRKFGAEKKATIHKFWRWYINKDVVSTLQAMPETVEFYHNKSTDKLQHGCLLPNPIKICLHSSTSAKFSPFTKSKKNRLPKVQEIMFGGPSKVFTHKTVADETHNRKSINFC